MDFCELAEFFTMALRNTNPLVTSAGSAEGINGGEEKSIMKLIIEAFSKIGNHILNEDPM